MTPAIVLLTVAAPALADPPASWHVTDHVSAMHVLMLLLFIPLALFVVITLLVYVPSLARGEKYQPGRSWHNEAEWFGGPTEGVEATDKVDAAAIESGQERRGGASARW